MAAIPTKTWSSSFPSFQLLRQHSAPRFQLSDPRCVCQPEDQRAPSASTVRSTTTKRNRQDPTQSRSARMDIKLGAERRPSAHRIPISVQRRYRRKVRYSPVLARSLEAARATTRRVRTVPPEVAMSLKAVLQHQTRLLRARALRLQQKQLRRQMEKLCLAQHLPRTPQQHQQARQK